MGAGDNDSRVEVLKEIRDEIRGVRSELEQLRIARLAASGVRTERVERNVRWRMASMVSTGALAMVALVLALRPGPRSTPVAPSAPVAAPAPVAMAPAVPPAPAAPPRATGAPVTPAPIAQPAVAAKPVAKLAPRLLASAPAAVQVAPPVKKRVKIESPEAAMYAPDDGDTIPFPPPRRVRVHKMSYGPVESEPAKL
jgi:hypothetical protein